MRAGAPLGPHLFTPCPPLTGRPEMQKKGGEKSFAELHRLTREKYTPTLFPLRLVINSKRRELEEEEVKMTFRLSRCCSIYLF